MSLTTYMAQKETVYPTLATWKDFRGNLARVTIRSSFAEQRSAAVPEGKSLVLSDSFASTEVRHVYHTKSEHQYERRGSAATFSVPVGAGAAAGSFSNSPGATTVPTPQQRGSKDTEKLPPRAADGGSLLQPVSNSVGTYGKYDALVRSGGLAGDAALSLLSKGRHVDELPVPPSNTHEARPAVYPASVLSDRSLSRGGVRRSRSPAASEQTLASQPPPTPATIVPQPSYPAQPPPSRENVWRNTPDRSASLEVHSKGGTTWSARQSDWAAAGGRMGETDRRAAAETVRQGEARRRQEDEAAADKANVQRKESAARAQQIREEEADLSHLRRTQAQKEATFQQTQRLLAEKKLLAKQQAEREAEVFRLREQRDATAAKEHERAARQAEDARQRQETQTRLRASTVSDETRWRGEREPDTARQQAAIEAEAARGREAEEDRLRQAAAVKERAKQQAEREPSETRLRGEPEAGQARTRQEVETDALLVRLREEREARAKQRADREAHDARIREADAAKDRTRLRAVREAEEARQREAAAAAEERATQRAALEAEEAGLREAAAAKERATQRAAREAEEAGLREAAAAKERATQRAAREAEGAGLREAAAAKERATQRAAREAEEAGLREAAAAKERATQRAAREAEEAGLREVAAAKERATQRAAREAEEARQREETRAKQTTARKAEETDLVDVAAEANARIFAERGAKLAQLREQRQAADIRVSASALETTRPTSANQRFTSDLPPPAYHECTEGDETAITLYGYRMQYASDSGKQQPGSAGPAVEGYAPSLRELRDAQTDRSSVRGWPAAEKHWCRAVDDLEFALEKRLRELDRWQRAEENNAAERATVEGTLRKMTAELEATRRADELAALRLRNLTTKQGAAHVRRDSPPEESKTGFPSGDVLLGVYQSAWSSFDAFACDVVDALAEYDPRGNVAKAFVHNIMLPAFQATQAYVEGTILRKQERMVQLFGPTAQFTRRDSDDVAWQFFLFTQQLKMPAEIAALSDVAVQTLIQKTDASSGERSTPKSLVGLAQELLQEGVNAGRFARGLTVQQVVRHFLRLHTYAMLSDPRCYLHPAPGTRLSFSEKHCIEVLSPGVKRYGRIKEGDKVEVVLCGLYFEDPRTADARPKVPMMVRRLSAEDAAN
jgi:hypothetical protein